MTVGSEIMISTMAFIIRTLQIALFLPIGTLGFSWGGSKGRNSKLQFTPVIQLQTSDVR